MARISALASAIYHGLRCRRARSLVANTCSFVKVAMSAAPVNQGLLTANGITCALISTLTRIVGAVESSG